MDKNCSIPLQEIIFYIPRTNKPRTPALVTWQGVYGTLKTLKMNLATLKTLKTVLILGKTLKTLENFEKSFKTLKKYNAMLSDHFRKNSFDFVQIKFKLKVYRAKKSLAALVLYEWIKAQKFYARFFSRLQLPFKFSRLCICKQISKQKTKQ